MAKVQLIGDSEILIELETIRRSVTEARSNTGALPSYSYAIDQRWMVDQDRDRAIAEAWASETSMAARPRLNSMLALSDIALVDQAQTGAASTARAGAGPSRFFAWNRTRTEGWTTQADQSIRTQADQSIRLVDFDSPLIGGIERIPDFGLSMARQLGPVFCIPDNRDLRQYWDRVEGSLLRIRNCMDISGVRRDLPLFAPEIDPRLLVRARAAGLSLEDVLSAVSGNLPPYRFTYLIERARSYAATLQGFGTALLAALERRDLEELNRIRTVQQQNILRNTTRLRETEINMAVETITQLERQQAAIEYRRDYYRGLIDGQLSPWERTQQISRHAANTSTIAAMSLSGTAGVLNLLPQLGAPTAMKYGGLELGRSAEAFTNVLRDTATVAELVASSAGLEAGFQRRAEGWAHQVELAERELAQIDRQLVAAGLRRDIAERALEIHQESVEQIEEIFQFYSDRFTNLGLYTYLSTTMQRVYREAYNAALAMARLPNRHTASSAATM